MVILLFRKITNKKLSPKCHYIIWLVFIIALICPIPTPSKISVYNYIHVERVKPSAREVSNDILSVESEIDSKLKEQIEANYHKINKNYLEIVFSNIWFAVTMINLSKVIYMQIVLNRKTGNREIKEERIVGILERCKKRLKIKKNIKLIEHHIIKTPSTMGVFRVKIFLPAEILQLDDSSIVAIMMHELSHYKRKDNLLNLFINVVKCMHWYNPILKYPFRCMKKDIVLATDEMATKDMEEDEKLEYCKVIATVAQMYSFRNEREVVLGLVTEINVIEDRVDILLMKEVFEKNAKTIMIATISSILLIWLIFYPSCYGIFDVPRLFIKLEDGSVVEATKIQESESDVKTTISVKEKENFKLFTNGGRCENFVVYDKTDLTNGKTYRASVDITSTGICCFQTGEYIYKFTLAYGINRSKEYMIKIVVE